MRKTQANKRPRREYRDIKIRLEVVVDIVRAPVWLHLFHSWSQSSVVFFGLVGVHFGSSKYFVVFISSARVGFTYFRDKLPGTPLVLLASARTAVDFSVSRIQL